MTGRQQLFEDLESGKAQQVPVALAAFGTPIEVGSVPRQVIYAIPGLRQVHSADVFWSKLQGRLQKRLDLLLEPFQAYYVELPEDERQATLARLSKYPNWAGFALWFTRRVNLFRHGAHYTLTLELHGEPLHLPAELEFPDNRVLTEAEAESMRAAQLASYRRNLETLVELAADFDLDQVERSVLIRLLRQSPRRLRKHFLELKDRMRTAMVLSELRRTDARFSQYHELYRARRLKRRWLAYLGPTNSGKTHRAMEQVAKAGSALYLSPLRLMALENQERLEEQGIPCTLITGEEQIIREGATHYCCTMEEFGRFQNTRFDVVVVDEVQLLGDAQRGWAWTDALVGAYTERLIMTGPELVTPSLEHLCRICNDELTIEHTRRLTPLAVDPQPPHLQRIPAGSIIVDFSRRGVLELKALLEQRGRRAAVIYGALSPVVRREQARRFREGEVEIMVATDAIGMGLNLPAHRLYFRTDEKFDGTTVRTLTGQEIKQIAGRAGRYGFSESGLAGGFEHTVIHTIRRGLAEPDPALDLKKFAVRPDYGHLKTLADALGERSLLRVWLTFIESVNYGEHFMAVLPEELMNWIGRLDDPTIDLRLRWIFASVPIHGGPESPARLSALAWLRQVHQGGIVPLPHLGRLQDLRSLEETLHELEVYIHLWRALPEYFVEEEEALARRETINDRILEILTATRSSRRR